MLARRFVVLGTGDLLAQQITNWQAVTSYVEVGGLPHAEWVQLSAVGGGVAAGRTFIDPAYAFRQDCTVTRAKFHVTTYNTAGWKLKVFRYDGVSAYDMVEESQAVDPGGAGDYQFDLTTPIPVRMGDIPGIYIPGNNPANELGVSGSRVLNMRYATEIDVTGSNAFANVLDPLLEITCYANRPYLAVTGDSIMEGHGPTDWHAIMHDAGAITNPGGEEDQELTNRMRARIGSGAVLQYQNFAAGSQDYTWINATSLARCIAVSPHTIMILCGVNDLSNGRTWEQVVADLDAIKAQITTERLAICELLPWTNGSDGQSATLRTWNANIAAWCSVNSAKLIVCHDAMGQIRAGTGELDDLIAAYDHDGVHLTPAGVDALSKLIVAQL